ncbi:MAG: hypothetical protein QW077_06880 [Candidatus Caldarchaeum sp.]
MPSSVIGIVSGCLLGLGLSALGYTSRGLRRVVGMLCGLVF